MRLLLALAIAASGGAARPDSVEGRVGQILEALERWDLAEVESKIAAMPADTDPSLLRELQGRSRFFSGDYAAADGLLRGLDSPYASLAANSLELTHDYDHRTSPHFVLSFPRGMDGILAPYALETLELARARIGQDLGVLPQETIRVEVLPDTTALSRMTPLTEAEIQASGVIAMCKYNKLMIVSPRAMERGYAWQDTLAHELTHYLITRKSLNKTPIWLHEGIAKFEESRWRGPAGDGLSPAAAALLARRLAQGTLIPFEKMHPSIALLPTQEDAALAFAEVFTAIEYLVNERHASLERLLDELAHDASDTHAVEVVAGESFERLTREWRSYLRKRPMPKEFAPLTPRKLAFRDTTALDKHPGKAERETTAELSDELDDAVARRHAHLGALLFARSRRSAAAAELRDAESRAGARSPSLSNLYAHTLVELHRDEEAERVLRASLVPFPDIAQTHRRLAEIAARAARWDEARSQFQAANAVDPFDPQIHLGLLRVADAQKDAPSLARETAVLKELQE